MSGLRLEWNEAKNAANQRKYGIAFDEASRAFDDPVCLSTPDRIKDGEQRWHTFGRVGSVLLIVTHTVREEDEDGELVETIRIISARKTSPRETRRYENEDC